MWRFKYNSSEKISYTLCTRPQWNNVCDCQLLSFHYHYGGVKLLFCPVGILFIVNSSLLSHLTHLFFFFSLSVETCGINAIPVPVQFTVQVWKKPLYGKSSAFYSEWEGGSEWTSKGENESEWMSEQVKESE